MDILGLDVTWAPEFAEAGWILRVDRRQQGRRSRTGTLAGPLATATYKDKLCAVPFNSNTQLLWYRTDLVPTPPKTWDEMIKMAERPGRAGQAALHRDPGRPVRGPHRLVQHAARQRRRQRPQRRRHRAVARARRPSRALDDHAAAGDVAGGRPVAVGADGERQPAGHGVGHGGLRAQLPVRLSVDEGEQARPVRELQVGAVPGGDRRTSRRTSPSAASTWPSAPTPSTPIRPSRPTLCLRNRENQKIGAVKGGVPPSLADLYDDPALPADATRSPRTSRRRWRAPPSGR